MYGITLILVLAVVGGVIAFIGDRLGTRIGKKKLSIFGLRPRHTAVIVTIFTGICITTGTVGIMAAAASVLAMSTALRGPLPWTSRRSSAMVRSGGAPASWWTTVM